MNAAVARSTPGDRILRYTKWIAGIVVPFLVVASVILYGFPGRTGDLFAWPIAPPLSAMFLASAYLGGIWFFGQVLRQQAWHRVAYGFPAVVVFATLASIATLEHLDKFHSGHISFITWLVLYLTTPFLTLGALLANRTADDRSVDPRDANVPLPARLLFALIGVAALATGLTLFLAPTMMISLWPWAITPLTAQIVGAVLTLPGSVNLWLLADRRWSSFRILFQAQIVGLVFIVGALVLARSDLRWDRPSTPLLVIGLAVSLLLYVLFYVYYERRREAVQVSRVG